MTLEQIVAHILKIKEVDIEYARYAVNYYDKQLPWMGIKAAVREACQREESVRRAEGVGQP